MLRMGVFADSKRVDILDNQRVTGTLFSMIDAAKLYILNNIRCAFIIDGSSLHRKERPEIPLSAIREALFNAFCHRSHEDNAAIQVDIFWDVVDIYSLGLFPSGLTPEDYLSGEITAPKPHNQLIAATLCKSGDIKTYGTGLQHIKTACDAQGVPVEMFQRGGVHVRFTRSKGVAAGDSPTTANSRRQEDARTAILRYARSHDGTITAAATELLGEKDYTARRLLNTMVEEGLLEKAGGRRRRVYKVV